MTPSALQMLFAQRRARLLTFFGPSGVGKTTVKNGLISKNPLFSRVVTSTTRQARPGEANGVDYFFLSPAEFRQRAAEGRFLETNQFNGNSYGLEAEELARHLRNSKWPAMDIDINGASSLRKLLGSSCLFSVFVKPPREEVIRQRLVSRGSETEESIRKRLEIGRGELARIEREIAYDFELVNDEVAQAVDRLEQELLRRFPHIASRT